MLDLGGVLVQLDEEAFQAAWTQLGVPRRKLERFLAGPRNRDWNLGRIPPEDFPRLLRRDLGLPGWPADRLRQAWNALIGEADPAVADLARRAAAGGLRVGLLSNTDPWHWEAAARQLPFREFDPLGLSFELAALKPDPAIFRNVLAAGDPELPRPRPEEILFVDDRAENLVAAAQAGFRTWHHEGGAAGLTRLETLLDLDSGGRLEIRARPRP
ncbi:MAG: HAD family phosphatase [bacterium]|jgi:HAD superfamily hydrolase (TIGR01509 family)|nr:HAD family phosphatase [bacterium]